MFFYGCVSIAYPSVFIFDFEMTPHWELISMCYSLSYSVYAYIKVLMLIRVLLSLNFKWLLIGSLHQCVAAYPRVSMLVSIYDCLSECFYIWFFNDSSLGAYINVLQLIRRCLCLYHFTIAQPIVIRYIDISSQWGVI